MSVFVTYIEIADRRGHILTIVDWKSCGERGEARKGKASKREQLHTEDLTEPVIRCGYQRGLNS